MFFTQMCISSTYRPYLKVANLLLHWLCAQILYMHYMQPIRICPDFLGHTKLAIDVPQGCRVIQVLHITMYYYRLKQLLGKRHTGKKKRAQIILDCNTEEPKCLGHQPSPRLWHLHLHIFSNQPASRASHGIGRVPVT